VKVSFALCSLPKGIFLSARTLYEHWESAKMVKGHISTCYPRPYVSIFSMIPSVSFGLSFFWIFVFFPLRLTEITDLAAFFLSAYLERSGDW
jgi:hypothetical protein